MLHSRAIEMDASAPPTEGQRADSPGPLVVGRDLTVTQNQLHNRSASRLLWRAPLQGLLTIGKLKHGGKFRGGGCGRLPWQGNGGNRWRRMGGRGSRAILTAIDLSGPVRRFRSRPTQSPLLTSPITNGVTSAVSRTPSAAPVQSKILQRLGLGLQSYIANSWSRLLGSYFKKPAPAIAMTAPMPIRMIPG